MHVLITVPESQVGAALEALKRAGIPARRRDADVELVPPPARATPGLELFGGTHSRAAPAGAWTRTWGPPAVSIGQAALGTTVWLMRGDGGTVTWFPSIELDVVLLERGPCPEDLARELGEAGVARVLAIAAQGDEATR